MPHFVVECSENVIAIKTPEAIMQAVYNAAEATGLFVVGDSKVRINPFKYCKPGKSKNDFIHVFAYIMQGRNTEQKNNLSKKIVTALNAMFPAVPVIAINILEIEKAAYFDKSMIKNLTMQ